MKSLRLSLLAALLGLTALGCETTIIEEPLTDGDATYVRSVNFVFTMDDATVNGSVASVQYDVPAVTRAVVENGAVLLFFREQGTWTAMPYTFGVESPDLPAVDYTITMGYGFEYRLVEVFYEASTEAVDLELQPDREIKAVIIESFPLSKTGIDLTDYAAVKAYFGLPD